MPLTELAIRNAKGLPKQYKLFDGGGLYLVVTPNGGKWWRFKYRFQGKEKLLSLGTHPETSLKEARIKHADARKLLSAGIDPMDNRRAQKAAASVQGDIFEVIAREWYEKNKTQWADSHSSKIIARLENDVFPWMGSRPIVSIKAPEILAVVRRIESRGALDTAHRVLQNCGQVMRYAVATGRADRDPTHDLKGALTPVQQSHYASITDPDGVSELLRAMEGFRGTMVVKSALMLAPLVFVRPGELRKAKWKDIDLDKATWRYLVTKTKTEHLVPLPHQAIAILRELHALTGRHEHVFPGRDPKHPMSDAAINAALKRMGYDTQTEITGHGFRAMARTLLHEELGFDPHVIEHQLAHKVPDALGKAYNRTKFIQQRTEMMQAWADYLDRLKVGSATLPAKKAA